MNLIAAVDNNWAIGYKGQLLVRIPADHRMFRQETLDKVIVYGRKTLETFPLAQPLDRRVNIVLSSNPDYKVRNATVVHSIDELLAELEKERKTIEQDIVLLDLQTPHLTREQIIYWLYRYKNRNVPTAEYDRFIVEALINRVYVSDTPDGTELTVLINISEHNTVKVSGSDFEAMVHHSSQYPNRIIPYPSFGMIVFSIKI